MPTPAEPCPEPPRPTDPHPTERRPAADRPPRPPARAAVAMRPTATLRAASSPSRADMAGRSTLVRIIAWDDALLDQLGHDPRSLYVERFWLSILGPSATWFLRAVAHRFDAEPEGFTIDLKDTARALGIGARAGANGALYRTLERILSFGFAQYTDVDVLAVRRRMAPLTRRQQQRLTPALQLEHDAWTDANGPTVAPSVDDLRRRARALALSLIELGEDVEATEQQLHRWQFHPALAHDSVRWAASVHEHRRTHGPALPDADRSPGGDAA